MYFCEVSTLRSSFCVLFLILQYIIEIWFVRRVSTNPSALNLRRRYVAFHASYYGLVCFHALAENLDIFLRTFASTHFLHISAMCFFPFIHGHRVVCNKQHRLPIDGSRIYTNFPFSAPSVMITYALFTLCDNATWENKKAQSCLHRLHFTCYKY